MGRHPGDELQTTHPLEVGAAGAVPVAGPVHAALGYHKVQVRMDIDPVPEGLNGDDKPGYEGFPRQGFEVLHEGPDGRTAELIQEPTPGPAKREGEADKNGCSMNRVPLRFSEVFEYFFEVVIFCRSMWVEGRGLVVYNRDFSLVSERVQG
jgi:hypothetical protein